ncbi:hypothetical protein R3P38DRAFT_3201524 [Favolaschia claudopus]|uniref:Uncharacterized protein n=1 Tax=Favolaschia claudopus TaxID=2862362 RepID=A0AAW0AU07_9AGAR
MFENMLDGNERAALAETDRLVSRPGQAHIDSSSSTSPRATRESDRALDAEDRRIVSHKSK